MSTGTEFNIRDVVLIPYTLMVSKPLMGTLQPAALININLGI